MQLDSHFAPFSQLRTYLSLFSVPFYNAIDKPIYSMHYLTTSFIKQKALIEENEKLRAEVLFLRASVQDLLAKNKEKKRLKTLVQKNRLTNYFAKLTPAKLLAVTLDMAPQQMLLNKGLHDQVYVGQPVIDGYGILGQVVHVDELTSRVLLLTDVSSAIPVQIERTGFRAIAIGMGKDSEMSLVHVPDMADVLPGDQVVASGMGLHYPAGYPVGKIASVKHLNGQHFTQILISPSAHFYQGRQVLLVWPKKNELALKALLKSH